jgi:hypothetical protein
MHRTCVAVVLLSMSLLTLPDVAATSTDPVFADVTAAAGIRFRHQSGAAGRKYLPETMGSGGAFLDADGDGWLDVLLINSKMWTAGGAPIRHALYHNNANGTFSDVTAASGLGVEMYGMGVAAGDYDNDGRIDVYITGLDGNRLFRGAGGGKFTDVTDTAGTAGGGFSTSAAWVDYDADGKLDLFVARYVDWSREKDLFCTLDGKSKSYCTPESYKGRAAFCFTIAATAPSRMSRVPQDSTIRPRKHSAWRCLISTAMERSIFSSPTTRSRIGCIAIAETARLSMLERPRASLSTSRAWRVPGWVSTRRISTGPAARAWSSAISRTR